MVRIYDNFEIDDLSGKSLTQEEMTQRHSEKILHLQVQSFFLQTFLIHSS